MSARSKKTKSKSSEVEQALQELQAARSEIERLNKIRDEALQNVKKAQKDYEVTAESAKVTKEKAERGLKVLDQLHSKTTDPQAEAPEYHSKDYWNDRYEKESSTKSVGGAGKRSEDVEIYEWYVSFQKISSLLKRDIQTIMTKTNEKKCNVMVPGCGNSLLAEDLVEIGATSVVGIDYSSVIVAKMNQHLKELPNAIGDKVTYREGDVCKLVQEATSSYDLIVDKGTLDAIASDNTSDTTKDGKAKQKTDQIGQYLKEMWRVLKQCGYLVLITTMPKDIMDALVLPQLFTWDKEIKDMIPAYEWKSGLNEKLTADGGGDVFYYALKKDEDILSQKDLMMDTIQSLLEEAKKVKLEDDDWEAERENEVNSATDDTRMKYDWNADSPLERIYTIQDLQHEGFRRWPILPTIQECQVRLDIEYESSYLVAGGHIVLQFYFDGVWNDNDEIRLIAVPTQREIDKEREKETYKERMTSCYRVNEIALESFEYLDNAIMERECSEEREGERERDGREREQYWLGRGKMKLKLPDYGVYLRVIWLREFEPVEEEMTLDRDRDREREREREKNAMTISTSHSLSLSPSSCQKHYVMITESSDFTVKFPIYPYNPCLPPVLANKPKDAMNRRSAKDLDMKTLSLDFQQFQVTIDDLQNISKLSINISLIEKEKEKEKEEERERERERNAQISRVMAFCYHENCDDQIEAKSEKEREKENERDRERDGDRERNRKREKELDRRKRERDRERGNVRDKDFTILLEVDLISFSSSSSSGHATSIETIYLPISISNSDIDFQCIQVQGAIGEIVTSPLTTTRTRTRTSSIALRLPYERQEQGQGQGRDFNNMLLNTIVVQDCLSLQQTLTKTERERETERVHESSSFSSSSTSHVAIFCRYCDQMIISPGILQKVHPLPTGIFDENIHEFICCEDVSCMSLTTEDMAFLPHALYIGSIYGIVHGSHINSCVFNIKANNSLCDIFNPMGSTIWSSPIKLLLPDNKSSSSSNLMIEKETRRKMIQSAFRPIIGIESATFRCSRCDMHLGDASLLIGPTFDEEELQELNGDENEEKILNYEFKRESIDSVKIFWNRVSIRGVSDYCQGDEEIVFAVSTEQLLARTCVYVFEKLNQPVCVFFMACDIDKKIQGGKDIEVIIVRLLNKGLKKFNSEDHADPSMLRHCTLEQHVKVCYQTGKAVDLIKGKEMRVPLDQDQYKECKKILKSKAKDGQVGQLKNETIVSLRL